MNRTEVIDRIEQNAVLDQVYKLEQQRLLHIVDFALACTDPACKPVYNDVLRKMVNQITGRKAMRTDLRSQSYNEVLLAFIDWLLPDMPEEEETDSAIFEDDGFTIIDRSGKLFL